LTEKLPQRLKAVDSNPHQVRLRHLATVLEIALGEPISLFDFILNRISELDLTSPPGQDAAARLMDEAVVWAVEDGKYSGEFYTPQGVVELMLELADPQPGNRIYDPCFGSGGLLLACARRLKERAKLLPLRVWNDVRTNSFFGVEINSLSYVIGMTRLVLAGIPEPRLELGDALERSAHKLSSSEKFDVIVACPPWGGRPEIHGRIHPEGNFLFPSKNSENLFLQHVARSLRPGGKAVIALPEGMLFRAGTDSDVRKWLLEEFRVDGVISLPSGTFAPYTNIKANLLLFRRERPAKMVRFCVIHSLAGAGRKRPSASELPALPVDVARRFRIGEESDDLWETPITDLGHREWELVAKPPGVDQLQQLLNGVQSADKSVSVSVLGSIADVFTGTSYDKRTTVNAQNDKRALPGLIRVSDLTEGRIGLPTLFLTEVAREKLNARFHVRSGDILATTSGSIGKIALVRATPTPLVASKSVVIIRPKEGVSSGYLSALLQSDSCRSWLIGHAQGSTIQHLSVRTLRQLPVAVPDLPIQERVGLVFEGRRGEALSILLEILTGSRPDPVAEWLESDEAVKAILDKNSDDWGSNWLNSHVEHFVPKTLLPENLASTVGRGTSDFVTLHDGRTIPRILVSTSNGQTTRWTMLLERLAQSSKDVRNRTVHLQEPSPDPRLTAWLMHFSEALEGLLGLNRIPEGTAQLSIFEGTLAGISASSKLLTKRSHPAVSIALSLVRRVERLVGDLREQLLRSVSIRATINPEVIPAGRSSEVMLRVSNESPLPLRRFSVRTEPSVGEVSISFLKEGQEITVPLAIPAESPGFYDFQVLWSGVKLNGTTGVSDRIPLRIEVLSQPHTVEAAATDDLGKSPYSAGSPVESQDMLFGRDDVIDRIKRQLNTTRKANVILLEGNRRTGKTSILQCLASPGVLPDWVPVNCSFQGGEGAEGTAGLHTREVFRLMAREIGWQAYDAGFETWFPDIKSPDPKKKFQPQFSKALSTVFATDRPFEVFELYLQEAIEACRPRRLLLMLDEFDKLQEGIDNKITSPQVPENIRYLIHKYSDLSAILTGSRRIKRLREEYWSALFGFGHRIGISALPLDAARLLVTRPVEGRLVYVDEARDRLAELCACHPFLMQSLCNRVFEDAVRNHIRTITVSIVESAALEMVQDNEHFSTLWGYAGTERRRVVLALIERLASGLDPITFSLLETKLEELGIQVPPGERLGDDIEFLRELEFLDLDSQTTVTAYRITVPLFGDWIRRTVDFDYLRQKATMEGQAKLK
jgi:type I restriction enzyme M protein